MEDVQEPSTSLCNGSQDTFEENQEKKAIIPVGRKRLTRSRYEIFHCGGGGKGEEGWYRRVFSGGVLEDCSVSTESKTSSCISNRYESETTSPRASTSGSEGQPNATTAPCPWRDFFRVFRKGPALSFHTLPPLKEGVPKQSKRRSRSRKFREAIVPTLNSPLDGEFCQFKSSWKNFSLSELQAATDTFSKEKLIGEGSYAEVYKGQLEDGQLVAIKRLTKGSPEEMNVDFLSELGIIVHVDRPNIAKVIGYGIEGGMHLALESSANGA